MLCAGAETLQPEDWTRLGCGRSARSCAVRLAKLHRGGEDDEGERPGGERVRQDDWCAIGWKGQADKCGYTAANPLVSISSLLFDSRVNFPSAVPVPTHPY